MQNQTQSKPSVAIYAKAIAGASCFIVMLEDKEIARKTSVLPQSSAATTFSNTLETIRDALRHCVQTQIDVAEGVTLFVDLAAVARLWRGNHDVWAATGSFVRTDGKPAKHPEIWGEVLAFHQMHGAVHFAFPDKPARLMLRVAEVEARKAALENVGEAA